MTTKTWTRDHDPDAVLDYGCDWTAWLAGDTITASSWTVSGTGLTIDSDSNTTTTTTVWVSGGTDGTNYDLTNHIVTDDGREDDRTLVLVCKSR